jgi:4-hydroxybenzoate polyprenyltransferase
MRAWAEQWYSRLSPATRRRLIDYTHLTRLDHLAEVILLLWPTLWALWVASGGRPGLKLLAIFLLGAVLLRSVGYVINDVLDRNIDPYMRHARTRPVAARRVAPFEAITLAAVLTAAVWLLALCLGTAAVRLVWIGVGIAAAYPLIKRYFPIPELYLGMISGWGVPVAFAAVLGTVPRAGWLLLVAAVLWAGVHGTWRAIAHRADDARLGVKSSALLFGDLDRLMIGAMQLMLIAALLLVGRSLGLGWIYYMAITAGAVGFVWQQWIARNRDAEGCHRALLGNQWFGAIVLAGLIVEYALRH